MSIFGRIVTSTQVEAAVVDTLRTWLPDYLAEVCRQSGRDPATLPPPVAGDIFAMAQMQRRTSDKLPSIVVNVTGETKPVKMGRGKFRFTWPLDVVIGVGARDMQLALEGRGIYAGAVRALLVQKCGLDGFAAAIRPVGAAYDDATQSETRDTIGFAHMQFEIDVDDVVAHGMGPATPSVDPLVEPDDYPTTEFTELTTTLETEIT